MTDSNTLRFSPEKNRRWLFPLCALAWNEIVYYGGKIIAEGFTHHNVVSGVDNLIPVVPWTVAIYFGCYLFWVANYCYMARQSMPDAKRFFTADFLSKAVCLIFFVLYPTTNIRPDIVPFDIWDKALLFLYAIDTPVNLFPSMHCLTSWLCFIGVRDRKNANVLFKTGSLLAALSVFVAVLTTKQHAVVDVIAGIALAELSYMVAGHLHAKASS